MSKIGCYTYTFVFSEKEITSFITEFEKCFNDFFFDSLNSYRKTCDEMSYILYESLNYFFENAFNLEIGQKISIDMEITDRKIRVDFKSNGFSLCYDDLCKKQSKLDKILFDEFQLIKELSTKIEVLQEDKILRIEKEID